MTNNGQDRFVLMEGAYNLRDLGGYRNKDGLRVARGKVYRAASLSELSDGDHRILGRMGLRLICDLRSTRERLRHPSRLPVSDCEVWSHDQDSSAADLIRAVTAGASSDVAHAGMIALYGELPYEQAESYGILFRHIARNGVPLLFHCTAGKDRTGVAAALPLDLLDVPREVIFEDYLLSEQFFDRLVSKIGRGEVSDEPEDMTLAAWAPLLRADPDYLAALFATIDHRHGGTPAYARDVLLLDSAQINAIRDVMLTKTD